MAVFKIPPFIGSESCSHTPPRTTTTPMIVLALETGSTTAAVRTLAEDKPRAASTLRFSSLVLALCGVERASVA